MEHLIWKFGKVTCFDIIDDNYFVDKRRVEAICNGMVSRGIDVPWRADCRFDYMSSYDKDFITLLEKSRCMELNFGAETGSDRLLKAIKKDITPGQMIISLKKLKDWSPTISPYIFWMSGFPTESRKDLDETFGLMDNLSDINPRTQHIEIGIYTPYPSPMFDQLFSEYKLPKTLEEWGQEDIFHFRPPWHSKEYGDLLEGVSIVTKYAFFPEERIRELDVFDRLGYKILNKIARYRWSHRNFNHPLELKIVSEATKRIRGY